MRGTFIGPINVTRKDCREQAKQCTYNVKRKLKVARRGLYSTEALCIADCALAPDVVPSFISRGAITPSGAGALY
jgi:hypothetical protein